MIFKCKLIHILNGPACQQKWSQNGVYDNIYTYKSFFVFPGISNDQCIRNQLIDKTISHSVLYTDGSPPAFFLVKLTHG